MHGFTVFKRTGTHSDTLAAIGAADVAVVPLAGPIPAGMSAETPLHLARYHADARIKMD